MSNTEPGQTGPSTSPAPDTSAHQGGDVTQWMDDGPLEDAKQLAVTIEPAQGSTTPTMPVVAGVEL